ncbi:DUF4320 family protein [Paenibacillus polymyxa]|uniref:DUF4320 family protein n=1 Tax=Paenibacillus polymyxa TaxID=1406 RepID=UPI0005CE4437|nr:DUF4320 family protein [Paenibacillus polymyxa]KJD38099.1 hypothetical protein QD46_21525 [Paenibacillus polymyxa]MBY7740285.1 DUF4320 family protein [Paenibacillus polymyxa]MEE4580996.1 DUF4320 family protein [Paenibacillus polymyxa]
MVKRFKASFNQRGEMTGIYIMLGILIFSVFTFLWTDIEGIWSDKRKLAIAVDETFLQVQAEGGFDSTLRTYFYDLCRAQGLDVSKITITGTPKLVQRNGHVELNASITYTMKSLKPMGIGEITFPIPAEADGKVATYFRPGGTP